MSGFIVASLVRRSLPSASHFKPKVTDQAIESSLKIARLFEKHTTNDTNKKTMNFDEYVRTHAISYEEYKKEVIPIAQKHFNPEKAAKLSSEEYLQKAYHRHIDGCYNKYLADLNPDPSKLANPYIL